MTTNYYDAFIPSVTFNKNFTNNLVQNKAIIYKYPIEKKKIFLKGSYKNNNHLTMMSGAPNSNQEYLSLMKDEFVPNQKNLKEILKTLSSPKKKLLSILIFSSSILTGWVIAPSRKPLVCAGFSLLSASASLFLLKKLNVKDEFAIRKKIAENLSFDSNNFNLSIDLEKFAKENKISKIQLKNEISEIYKKFLEIMLQTMEINLENIQSLKKIKTTLGLSSQEIGQCHYDFAQKLYKDYIVMVERDETTYSNRMVENFFYLSDRIFSDDSKKGYQYESARIRKIFLFSEENVKQTILEKSSDLYKKFIQNSISDSSISNEKINHIGETLGLSIISRDSINESLYEKEIFEIVSKEKKISQDSRQILDSLKNLLNISDDKADKYLNQKTSPLFLSNIKPELEKLKKQVDNKEIDNSAEFLVSQASMFSLTSEIFSQNLLVIHKMILNEQIENSLKFVRVNKKNEVKEEIEKILSFQTNFQKLAEKIPEIKTSFNSKIEINKNITSEDIKKIYSTFISSFLVNQKISSKDENNCSKLREIFQISEKENEEIYNGIVGPLLSDQIKKIIEEKNYNEEKKNEIEKKISELKIKEKTAIIIKSDIYQVFLKNIFSKETIPSQKESNELGELRKFLSLEWKAIQLYHDQCGEQIYRKSVLEAMGATGIIPKNYWEGLENVRIRLFMSEKKAKEIFYSAVKEKLRMGFEKAISDNRNKSQGKQTESSDSGEDPTVVKGAGTSLGITVTNSQGNELINLVELYSKNSIFIEDESVSNERNQIPIYGQTGRAEIKNSAKSKIDYSYPVNLDGLFKKKITEDMYKDYLVECFSVKSQKEKRKLFNNLEKLGPILGLNSDEIQSIHSSVGSVVYRQYLAQALTKGFLDKSEMAFLSNIQATLSMDSGKCAEFIREAKKNKVSIMVESIFATSKVSADRVAEMRKVAEQLDVDLNKDLEISNDQRSRMFRVEIDSAIENGKITKENQELIKEIQKGFGLENNVSKKILLESISSRCENNLLNAVASLRRGNNNDAYFEIEKMLNFGNLLPIHIKNPIASQKERNELFSLFQTFMDETTEEKKVIEKVNLLKIMLGIN